LFKIVRNIRGKFTSIRPNLSDAKAQKSHNSELGTGYLPYRIQKNLDTHGFVLDEGLVEGKDRGEGLELRRSGSMKICQL